MTSLWNETDLTLATHGQLSSPFIHKVKGVSIDTRTLQLGDIFIAIQGEKSNGHNYLKQAFDKGASCAVVTHIPSELQANHSFLSVPNTLTALTKMGAYARQRFQGKMIAITGSVGKTTTKEMLRTTLTAFGQTHAAEGSYNNHLGVPLTLARLNPNADYCICEIGMNHSGEIAPLATLVKPDIALITTVASSHLGLMKNLDAIATEKSQIITAITKQGIAIIPETIYGIQFFEEIARYYHINLYTTGLSEQSNYQINHIDLHSNHSSFQIKINKQFYPVMLSSPGKHLIHDAALVLATITELKLEIERAVTALREFQVGSGRGKLLPLTLKSGILLDESYNASTLSIQAALHTLSLLGKHRRVAVLGDILELGTYSQQEHLALLPDLQQNTDLVFTCGSNMKIVFDHLPPHLQGKWCADAEQLIPFIEQQLKDQDTVLVKGSHGMHMHKIVKALTQKSVKGKIDAV